MRGVCLEIFTTKRGGRGSIASSAPVDYRESGREREPFSRRFASNSEMLISLLRQPECRRAARMRRALPRMSLAALALLAGWFAASARLLGQASDIPSAAPASDAANGQTTEQRGRALIDEMVAALGGELWLNRATVQLEGRGAAFFHGQPDTGISEYHEARRFPASGLPEADRIGFLTERGMIMPGKKIDVVQIWTANQGYEITFKGQTTLPKEQVEDYYRRRAHSVEEVVRTWIHAPGVMIIAEGTSMVERRLVDKVTVLSANNDAVTLELDATSHLPRRRTFQWRNDQFKDFDEDAEEYDDYHTFQGLPTAMTITRYHNGDMTSQRFFTKVVYNVPLAPALFDPSAVLSKK
jgi:hypothetical protein